MYHTRFMLGVLHNNLMLANIQNDHQLSPHKVITVLLTLFLMLYIKSPWFPYYKTGGLYVLIPFTYFAQPSPHYSY